MTHTSNIFSPTLIERLARARTDLRLGLPVILKGDRNDALVFAAEDINADRLIEARKLGAPELAITARRAETLRARAYDNDIARLEIAADADPEWISCVADPKDDLTRPMKGPFISLRGGDATLHRTAVRLVKSAWLLPAAVVVQLRAPVSADLTELDAGSVDALLSAPVAHRQVVTGNVPLSVSKAGRIHVFRPKDGGDDHVACEIGRPSRDKAALVRLHSACFTGDILGSMKCDCGPQLNAALSQMAAEGSGVLLYLNQEGRGIGLANKMRAYALQDQGFDTVEANHRLGFEDDERDFRTGADLLKRLGFSKVRLLTNNPAKVEMLSAQGVEVVERVPLKVGQNPLNEKYLDAKARKSGHII